ncbi:HD domain-containing protein [Actinoallomurus spadix]|uniref:HD domain-containing protein n=1 Tax=Actinoallomurus spadix TaxID=79912 RepID=A0ABN0VQI0_9ACTN|nr:HD domain-containing protein [Actinoallomurus spadix]MCO5990762.1 HD domain-containing protein [Actinoallomurus spadix]
MTALLEPLLARLPADVPITDRDRIRHAYEFAARCHEGQFRKSGDPYITHPVAVAEIAIDAGLDVATVCAALLHDILEDTDCDVTRLREEFGDEIATLVASITGLGYRHAPGAIGAADDRVLALKVLDRLHNMRTLRYLEKEKQRLRAQQTLDVMAPLAMRLGLRDVSDELESLARERLSVLSGDTGAAVRALALGALLLPPAVRSRYLDEWLGELDVLPSRRARTRFTLSLTLGMPALALTLRRRPTREVLSRRLLTGLRWLLRTDLRTWTPLTLLIGWMILETARTSVVDAVVTLITVPPVIHAGVVRLRARIGTDDPE